MTELSKADIERIHVVAGEVSADLLEYLRDELIRRNLVPDVAGFILMCTYGRLAGSMGDRTLGLDKMYELCTDSIIKNVFKLGFISERKRKH